MAKALPFAPVHIDLRALIAGDRLCALSQDLRLRDRTRWDKSDLGVTVQIGDTDRAGIFDDPVGLALVVCLPC